MKILVFGGDKRQYYTAEYLALCGNDVTISGFDTELDIPKCLKVCRGCTAIGFDAVIFGIPSFDVGGKIRCPLSSEEYYLGSIIREASPCRVFCAMASSFEKALMREYGIDYTEYHTREKLCMMNAIPTAEGALRIFFENSVQTVYDSNFCVLGYGRIGKILSSRLFALGGKVTVGARSERSLAEAECNGYSAVSLYSGEPDISDYDCIFNTIPSEIIRNDASIMKCNSLFIELASYPGGLSEKAKKAFGDRYIHAPALPGRFTPKSAGIIIGNCISELLAK